MATANYIVDPKATMPELDEEGDKLLVHVMERVIAAYIRARGTLPTLLAAVGELDGERVVVIMVEVDDEHSRPLAAIQPKTNEFVDLVDTPEGERIKPVYVRDPEGGFAQHPQVSA